MVQLALRPCRLTKRFTHAQKLFESAELVRCVKFGVAIRRIELCWNVGEFDKTTSHDFLKKKKSCFDMSCPLAKASSASHASARRCIRCQPDTCWNAN